MKKIPLKNSRKFATVDDEDYDFLMQWKWIYRNGYAVSGHKRYMHRIVNKTPHNKETDHKDNNRLNNQKKNLRNASKVQNSRNKSLIKHSSKYKGVSWDKSRNKWESYSTINYKKIHLGRYSSEKRAAKAYNCFAKKHFGEFARLNKIS